LVLIFEDLDQPFEACNRDLVRDAETKPSTREVASQDKIPEEKDRIFKGQPHQDDPA
jgi:hypothetical protein